MYGCKRVTLTTTMVSKNKNTRVKCEKWDSKNQKSIQKVQIRSCKHKQSPSKLNINRRKQELEKLLLNKALISPFQNYIFKVNSMIKSNSYLQDLLLAVWLFSWSAGLWNGQFSGICNIVLLSLVFFLLSVVHLTFHLFI